MSRAKKGAAFEGQVQVQKEAAESPFPIEQLLKRKQDAMDKKFQELKEDKKINDRLQALELKQQQTYHAGNTGPQEEKSDERDNYAMEGMGQEITHLKRSRARQHRRCTGRRGFFKWSSRGSNHRRRRRPNHRHCHTNIHSPFLPQHLFWLTDSTM